MGLVKSSVGIGALLCEGIGDTFRVSLTADPVKEIEAARKILNAVGIDGQCGLQIVSCPTCGRTKIDLIDLHTRFEAAVKAEGLSDLPVKVALMGCIVNGPGEAREADIGIAGGKGEALLFAKGEIIGKITEESVIPTLISRLKDMKQKKEGYYEHGSSKKERIAAVAAMAVALLQVILFVLFLFNIIENMYYLSSPLQCILIN